ncbi:type IV toxin-antitoxin system AbiEi family antitoxin domain-containing protein [Mycolicibacterium gadium]|nr:type IV toxin-antitoxin system AbiEi family antitoxin domain-containing protein [Mycolicibacterium gadium]
MAHEAVESIFAANGGVATTRQLLAVLSPKTLEYAVRTGTLIRVRRGVYSLTPPDASVRLAALDLACDVRVVACMQTAAEMYGFDTEPDHRLHILDPGTRVRPSREVMVHQRLGAPLKDVRGRLVTAPAWTAVEIARTLRRPRALAVLDAALHSESCTRLELVAAVDQQKGRRGIVQIRELVRLADARAESPMESEARLVFIDGGLPSPELQYTIVDRHGRVWRVDFAWPAAKVVAEYDSVEWHANPDGWKHDRMKSARLAECGWTTIPMVVDDVRKYPNELVRRIFGHLERAPLAG